MGNYRVRAYQSSASSAWLRYLLPILLTTVAVLYHSKHYYFFNNGSGGTDWRIGAPQVSIWNAYTLQPLPEARAFALTLANRDRAANGLPPLVEDPLLAEAAQRHAQDMLERNYFDHVSPEGTSPSDRFQQVGGSPSVGVGENIFMGRDSQAVGLTYRLVEEYQKGWMYSQGHRENLLRPEFTHFGYGIVVQGGRQYAVQEFATASR
jgi:uncharacterized protein YkwD